MRRCSHIGRWSIGRGVYIIEWSPWVPVSLELLAVAGDLPSLLSLLTDLPFHLFSMDGVAGGSSQSQAHAGTCASCAPVCCGPKQTFLHRQARLRYLLQKEEPAGQRQTSQPRGAVLPRGKLRWPSFCCCLVLFACFSKAGFVCVTVLAVLFCAQ